MLVLLLLLLLVRLLHVDNKLAEETLGDDMKHEDAEHHSPVGDHDKGHAVALGTLLGA